MAVESATTNRWANNLGGEPGIGKAQIAMNLAAQVIRFDEIEIHEWAKQPRNNRLDKGNGL